MDWCPAWWRDAEKEGEMKWQLIAIGCLSLREKAGRVGAHPDMGIIAPWLMGAGAFGIINFIYYVPSLCLSPVVSPSVLCSGISTTWWHTFNCTLIEDPAGMKKLFITFYDLVTFLASDKKTGIFAVSSERWCKVCGIFFKKCIFFIIIISKNHTLRFLFTHKVHIKFAIPH